MKYTIRELIKKIISTVFSISVILIIAAVLGLITAKPSQAAGGGGVFCDIAEGGGISSGRDSSPASLKVVFQDADGNRIQKRVDYDLNSTAKNIASYGTDTTWDGESTITNRSGSCNGFDIYGYRTFYSNINGKTYYKGNGWVLFCHDHPGGDPAVGSNTVAKFWVDDIDALPLGGGSGGGEDGTWKRVNDDNTSLSAVDTRFEVTNGSTTIVRFRWVPNYAGLSVKKYLRTSSGDILSNDATINNSKLQIFRDDGGSFWYTYQYPQENSVFESGPNPYVTKKVFGASRQTYMLRIFIPSGYQAVSLALEGGSSENCTIGTNSFGKYCETPLFSALNRAGDNGVMNIDIVYQKISTTPVSYYEVGCYKGSDTRFDNVRNLVANSDTKFYFAGFGVDGSNQSEPPVLDLFSGSTKVATLTGNAYAAASTLQNKGYNDVVDGVDYRYIYPVPDNLRNNSYTITPKLYQINGTYFSSGVANGVPGGTMVLGEGTSGCGAAMYPLAFPWLATLNGNVIASYGSLEGNASGLAYKNSKLSSGREAEYLVMSALASEGPFCSFYNYILTNISATSSTIGGNSANCTNGSGYQINAYPLNNNSGKDAIVQSAEKAYDALPSACKTLLSSTNTPSATSSFNNRNLTSCPKGKAYKIGNSSGEVFIGKSDVGSTSPYLNLSAVSERATIIVYGNATITQDILYSTTNTAFNQLPSLSIIATGDIRIRPITPGGNSLEHGVSKIQAALYSAGKTNTCFASNSINCGIRLYVYGMLVAKNGFLFQRTASDASGSAAETVTMSPNTILMPPPGLDLYSYNAARNVDYNLDTSEYGPRLK